MKTSHSRLLVLACLLASAIAARAPSSQALHLAQTEPEPETLAPQGQIGGSAQALAWAPDASVAYMGEGQRVRVLRVRPFGNPLQTPLRSSRLEGAVQGLDLASRWLYVAAGKGGLQVFDVSVADRPIRTGGLKLDDPVYDVAVEGRRAALALGMAGVAIVDLTNPSDPQLRGQLKLEAGAEAMSVRFEQGLAYVAAGVTGMHIVDARNPNAPFELGRLDRVDGNAMYVESLTLDPLTNQIYVVDGPRLHRVGVRDPRRPEVEATLTLPGRQIKAVSHESESLQILSLGELDAIPALHAVDLSDPDVFEVEMDIPLNLGPILSGLFDLPRPRLAIDSQQRVALVALGSLGARIVGPVRPPNQPMILDDAGALTWVEAVQARSALHGTLPGFSALIAAGAQGLVRSDVTVPPAAIVSGSADSPGHAQDVVSFGPTAYVADISGGLQVYDVPALDDPPRRSEANLIGSLPSLLAAARLAIAPDGSVLYVSDQISGLRIVDVSNPIRPQDLGGIDLGIDMPEGLSVAEGHLYVAAGSGLRIYHLADPQAPALRAQIETPGFARDVAAQAGRALVADDQAGLTLVDVSNPAQPAVLGSLDTPGSAQSVAFSARGDVAYLADGEGGLQAIDLAQAPEDWRIQARFTEAPQIVDVSRHEDHVYASAQGRGMLIFGDLDADGPSTGKAIIHLPLLAREWGR